MKIGKNLSIRFYTLFIPTAETLDVQTKQAISLKKNLNPNVLAFEEAVRESILRVIESFLNQTVDDTSHIAEKEQNVDERSY